MKLVFFTNYLNHHQVMVADELYEKLGNEYTFVSTLPVDVNLLKGGEDYSITRPYCLRAYDSDKNKLQALKLAREAEVCVFGADSMLYAIERAKHSNGLTFEVAERWLKRGLQNLASPRLIKWLLAYHTKFSKKTWYKLCASSFTAQDDLKLFAYKGRHYKWGYFTAVDMDKNTEKKNVETFPDVSTKENIHILWCARFLSLKHPELAVLLAAKLKKDGYDFQLDMLGDGKERIATEKLANKLNVSDKITFHGNQPNKIVLEKMKSSDIFLFTSDNLEGWGAVANEAMSNRCCLVASDAIGSTHYLLKDGETGIIFKSCNIDNLYKRVRFLLDNPEERVRIAENGYHYISDIWSPKNAAQSLLSLIYNLQNGHDTTIIDGPCSKA